MLHSIHIYTLILWDISTMPPGFEFEGAGWCKEFDQPDNASTSALLSA